MSHWAGAALAVLTGAHFFVRFYATPPDREGTPAGALASVMDPVSRTGQNRDTGWVNRLFNSEGSTPQYQELKFTLHRKLLDRINLEALSSMAGERVRAEARAAVARLVDEEKTPLSLPPSVTFW